MHEDDTTLRKCDPLYTYMLYGPQNPVFGFVFESEGLYSLIVKVATLRDVTIVVTWAIF